MLVVACRYFKSWFLIDLLSIIPFDVMGLLLAQSTVRQLQILRVLRIFKLTRLARIIGAARIAKRWEAYLSLSRALLNLIRFIIAIVLLVHWFACAYRLMPILEQQDDNWATFYFKAGSIDDIDPFRLWIVGMLWSSQTIVTVGYGDVPARTDGERVMCIICILCGGFVFAYVVGAVCSIVSDLDVINNEFYRELDLLNGFMRENELPGACTQIICIYLRGMCVNACICRGSMCKASHLFFLLQVIVSHTPLP